MKAYETVRSFGITLDDKEVEISIDIIEEYFNRVKEFIEYVEEMIMPEEE